MNREYFKASKGILWVTIGGVVLVGWFGDLLHRAQTEVFISFVLLASIVLLAVRSVTNTYLEIRNKRTLISSGYRNFGKDVIDIYNIFYIGRIPNFPLRQYGSRMVLYIKTSENNIAHASQREVNFSNDTIVSFLKRVKQINPNIKLDSEYEKIINGELLTSDPSENSMEKVDRSAADSLNKEDFK